MRLIEFILVYIFRVTLVHINTLHSKRISPFNSHHDHLENVAKLSVIVSTIVNMKMRYFFSDIVNWSSVTELCTLSLSQPLSEVPEETGISRGLSGVHTWSDTRGGGEWLPHPIAYPSARPHSPERHSNALTHPKVHHLPHPEVCHQTHTQIGDQTHTQERRGLYPRSERCGEGCEVGGRPKTAGAHGSSKESLCLPKHHD